MWASLTHVQSGRTPAFPSHCQRYMGGCYAFAEWKDPCISFTLPEVCGGCNACAEWQDPCISFTLPEVWKHFLLEKKCLSSTGIDHWTVFFLKFVCLKGLKIFSQMTEQRTSQSCSLCSVPMCSVAGTPPFWRLRFLLPLLLKTLKQCFGSGFRGLLDLDSESGSGFKVLPDPDRDFWLDPDLLNLD